MEEYIRNDPLLSQCGLNCGLCPRFHTDGDSRCPGCGGEDFFAKRPSCGVISCARKHGDIEYCFFCEEYPCKKFDGVTCFDSFISHKNMLSDFEKAKQIGIDVYRTELDEKVAILEYLLENYNDGRRKSFFCIAVNLLELKDIKTIMTQLGEETAQTNDVKEKAAAAARLIQKMADGRNVSLKLNKKK